MSKARFVRSVLKFALIALLVAQVAFISTLIALANSALSDGLAKVTTNCANCA